MQISFITDINFSFALLDKLIDLIINWALKTKIPQQQAFYSMRRQQSKQCQCEPFTLMVYLSKPSMTYLETEAIQ